MTTGPWYIVWYDALGADGWEDKHGPHITGPFRDRNEALEYADTCIGWDPVDGGYRHVELVGPGCDAVNPREEAEYWLEGQYELWLDDKRGDLTEDERALLDRHAPGWKEFVPED